LLMSVTAEFMCQQLNLAKITFCYSNYNNNNNIYFTIAQYTSGKSSTDKNIAIVVAPTGQIVQKYLLCGTRLVTQY